MWDTKHWTAWWEVITYSIKHLGYLQIMWYISGWFFSIIFSPTISWKVLFLAKLPFRVEAIKKNKQTFVMMEPNNHCLLGIQMGHRLKLRSSERYEGTTQLVICSIGWSIFQGPHHFESFFFAWPTPFSHVVEIFLKAHVFSTQWDPAKENTWPVDLGKCMFS